MSAFNLTVSKLRDGGLSFKAAAVMVMALPVMLFAAEAKIGFIDAERVAQDSAAGKRVQQKMEQEFSKRLDEMRALDKKLGERRDEITKNGSTWTESVRRDKEREFDDMARSLQSKQQNYQEDLNLRKREEFGNLAKIINDAVRAVALRDKYDVILQSAAYINPELDITEKVLQELNKEAANTNNKTPSPAKTPGTNNKTPAQKLSK